MKRFLVAIIVSICASAACAEQLDEGTSQPPAELATGSIGSAVSAALAPPKPAKLIPAAASFRPAQRASGRRCDHIGCRGYHLVGVGF
jgi:hypothetical protein